MEKLILHTFREGYDFDQIAETMTVGDLINFLSCYNEDTPVYLGFDNMYTVGGIRERMFEERYGDEENSED